MSRRIRWSEEKVAKCLESLEERSFAQRRVDKGPDAWRITPEGEAFIQSYQQPWYERPYGLLLIGREKSRLVVRKLLIDGRL